MRKGSPEALKGAADHRRRLTAAMVEAASSHGYAGATVSRVVQLAGVSRATFYEHFGCREECFLAAYRAEASAARCATAAAFETAPAGERPEAVLDFLLGGLAADPARARFLLVEALAAPPPLRAEHEELIEGAEGIVGRFLDEQAGPGAIQIPATALVAGVGDLLAGRALEGGGDLAGVRADLSRWIDAYRLAEGERPVQQHCWHELGRFAHSVPPGEAAAPALLPRGRSALPEEEAAGARRQRIVDATARLARERGYAALTVAQIAAAARVPRAAFYSHFEGKLEALMAAQTHALQGAMAAAAGGYSTPAPWPLRVWQACRAFFAFVAAVPSYAWLAFVESFAAGPAAIRQRQQNQMVFTLFLEEGYRQNPAAAGLPRSCSEAVAGAILGLMRKTVVEGRTERLLSLTPAATYTILAPFIGPREAAERVRGWAAEAP